MSITPSNNLTLIGRVSRDPELRSVSTAGGERSVLTLGVAVNRSFRADGEDARSADFFNVTVWGAQAETCAQYLSKGRLIAACVRLEPTSWTDGDGDTRYGMDLIANTVEFLDRPPRKDQNTGDAEAAADEPAKPRRRSTQQAQPASATH